MKILITGADGMLGSDLQKVLKKDHELILGTIDIFDITDIDTTINFIKINKPDLVIHAAAYTDVDGCESNIDQAYRVNALGARNIAVGCNYTDAAMVYISTDYVFDGQKGNSYTEFDATNPLSVYGKSKLEGENFVKRICDRHYIVRTSWLFGKNGKNFITTMLKLAEIRDEISVVDDQVGSPTYTLDLAKAISQLIAKPTYGTFHITNSDYCSWYQFAKEIFEIAGKSKIRVNRISTEELNRPAPRPKYSVLNNYCWHLQGYDKIRSYKEALREYISTII
ncbi:spore coat protein [Caloranaerobacter azorensis H53214]|uniref:dTDP-4-dehydrorhamnose reductase n=1 Tax=Caloranaerobacter azorensis H53214 TaxID=1156417 RepID=A0A096BEY4_9FIRM|nr:dTDP-4-dehydrorhamnose reductase [Caloranaerobacter azorensis]KGG79735.1 spore coat protein [Caloranaerobacter azorensis H53214]